MMFWGQSVGLGTEHHLVRYAPFDEEDTFLIIDSRTGHAKQASSPFLHEIQKILTEKHFGAMIPSYLSYAKCV